MKELELHTVCPGMPDVGGRLPDHLRALARQTDDHVHDHLKPGGLEPPYRIVKYRQRVATADIPGCLRVDGLKPQLHPDGLNPVEPGEKIDDLFTQTVRSGAYGQGDYFLTGNGGGVKLPQPLYRGVGAGEALKIGDEAFGRAFSRHKALCFFDGVRHIRPGADGKIPAAPAGAENTAAGANGAVPVRAAEASVQRKPVHLAAEAFPQI